ncbi:protein GRIM REAPER-like [Nymphaea colorata]|nr:protein GRIM REAPER-like [Nymphaea colorata]
MSSRLFLVLLFLVAFSELCVCTELRLTADQVGEIPPSKNLDSSPPGGTAIDGITHSAFLKAGYGDSLLGGPRKFHQHQQQRPNCPKGCRGLPGLHVCCGTSGCKNILRNRYHCGACHRPCPFGQACCEGFCVDTMDDENHCGKCGMACAAGVACIFGMCGYSLG